MPYERSFWVPNEQSNGEYWRYYYNKYLHGKVTPATVEAITKDHRQDWNNLLQLELVELQLGYATFCAHGSQTFLTIEHLFKKFYKDEDVYINNALGYLKAALVGREYCNTLLTNWEEWTLFLDKDKVFDSALGPDVSGLIAEIESSFGGTDLIRRNRSNLLGRVLRRICLLFELSILQKIIEKTWKNDLGPDLWTEEECDFINKYHCERSHWLDFRQYDDESAKKVAFDPSDIRLRITTRNKSDGLPGASVTDICENLIHMMIWDFVDELILFNSHEAIKGTGRCLECGQFYARSFYGYNQKYCSNQCKSRAAKRRQRISKKASTYKKRALK